MGWESFDVGKSKGTTGITTHKQHLNQLLCIYNIIISRRALAREGDYEMMPVCACVRALVSHADFSKTTTATGFL